MEKGTKGELAKKKLIEVASSLFMQNGYSNTGINDILLQAGMSKGSFYFHFSSKKDLALEVSKYYRRSIVEDWLRPLSDNKWDVFVEGVVSGLKKLAENNELYGCPIAVLGVEVAFIEKELADVYTSAMKRLIGVFSNSLKNSGLDEKAVQKLARKAFVIYEGYILYYRVSRDTAVFDYLEEDLKELTDKYI